jgi:hypothetical protein
VRRAGLQLHIAGQKPRSCGPKLTSIKVPSHVGYYDRSIARDHVDSVLHAAGAAAARLASAQKPVLSIHMWACFRVRARAWRTVYKLSKHGCREIFPFRVPHNTSLAFRDHDGLRSCILYFIMCTSTSPWSDQPEGKLGLG